MKMFFSFLGGFSKHLYKQFLKNEDLFYLDIQFKGITKKEYYDIATKLAKVIKYDQMILEYCSYANNPWIHVSYSVKNRSQVLTFFNHKTHSQGLTQLA
jgi:hypothetical protein